ncbi:TPA: phage major capsid protein [Vibrio cholerae O1]
MASEKNSADTLVRLTRSEIQGQEVLNYRGIPIREVDALINAEEKVV